MQDTAPTQPPAQSPTTILVADDDRDVLHVTSFVLRRAKERYRIISAPDGEVACRLARDKRPDLILLDWQMPNLSGVDALKRIKADPQTADIPVIMVTGMSEPERLEEAFAAGAADYLHKPVERIELLARVANTLALSDSYKKIKAQTAELEKLNAALTYERDQSEQLLHNILPRAAAEEMIRTGHYAPRRYERVTVVFSDLEGFTKQAAGMRPEELVKELEHCFSAFDEIIERHGLEKIKTIGDGYMCAGGVPEENQTNPCDAVAAAIEMQAFMKRWNEESRALDGRQWSLRIGMHTGAVVAGIIGKKRFAYDVWGDAVNLAARMEQHGVAGRINVSEETYRHVKDRYGCSFRGKLPAKNRGEVEMYLIDQETD